MPCNVPALYNAIALTGVYDFGRLEKIRSTLFTVSMK